MRKMQGGYLVPLLHLITMAVTAGAIYGAWLISGLIVAEGYSGRDGLGRVFAFLAVFIGFTAALMFFSFCAISVPREVRRARFWKAKRQLK